MEIDNPEYHIQSNNLDYFTKSEHAFFFGPTKIIGSDYDIYCEKGFYDTKKKEDILQKKQKLIIITA